MQFYGYRRDGKVLRQVIVTKQPGQPSNIQPTAITYPTVRAADADMARLNCGSAS
jgi:hypothetical protein